MSKTVVEMIKDCHIRKTYGFDKEFMICKTCNRYDICGSTNPDYVRYLKLHGIENAQGQKHNLIDTWRKKE